MCNRKQKQNNITTGYEKRFGMHVSYIYTFVISFSSSSLLPSLPFVLDGAERSKRTWLQRVCTNDSDRISTQLKPLLILCLCLVFRFVCIIIILFVCSTITITLAATHTHTRARTNTHTCKHTHTNAHPQPHRCINICIYLCIYIFICIG